MAGETTSAVATDAQRIADTEFNTAHVILGAPSNQATESLVTAGWTAAQNYAAQAFAAATQALSSLGTATAGLATIPPVDSSLTIPPLILAQFDALVASRPVAPNTTPSFVDQDFTSTLLTDLQTYIDLWVKGTYTGLPPDIEQAIWDRGRAREVVASNAKKREVSNHFARLGFLKPPGALAVALAEAEQQAQDNIISQSREVAIKQADLEQTNRRFAFETAWKIQEGLINYMTQKMQRALEIARLKPTLDAQVYGHQASVFGVDGQVYSARVGAEATKYRGDVDVAIATANLRVEAAKTSIQAMIQKITVLVESIRASAQISAQLAAAALASVNLSGGLHSSTSYGASLSESRSRSVTASVTTSAGRQENFTPSG